MQNAIIRPQIHAPAVVSNLEVFESSANPLAQQAASDIRSALRFGVGGPGGACASPGGRRIVPGGSGEPCVIRKRRCDCHVIGGNTLTTSGIGTASITARFGTVTLDSGDASFFVPYYIFVSAYQANNTSTVTNATELPVLLADSKSGQEPNLRRSSTSDPSFGITCTGYAETKEIECVDWRRFTSTNNQQLTLTFYNPNDVTIHVFAVIWGLPAAG